MKFETMILNKHRDFYWCIGLYNNGIVQLEGMSYLRYQLSVGIESKLGDGFMRCYNVYVGKLFLGN